MHTVLVLMLALVLTACGPDVVTATQGAASAGAASAQNAREQQKRIEDRVKAMDEAERKRVEGISDQVDRASH
jgi:hypothetical protein